ncbi:MAG: cyclic nucleotide-binding domain-containing protein [Fibrobacteria bacterium]|nr:cyclic nucleotide-binding domain-containing protein [Fibrobacteria bacterium]
MPKFRLEHEVRKGEIIFKEGDAGAEMYIIKTGRAKILKQEGDKLVEIATVGPGTVVGEMCLLDNEPRSATAIALEPLTIICINKGLLDHTLSKVPDWVRKVIRIVVQRLRKTTELRYQEILRGGILAVSWTIIQHASSELKDGKGKAKIPLHTLLSDIFDLFGSSEEDNRKVLNYLAKIKLGQITQEKTIEYFETEEIDIISELFEHCRQKRLSENTFVENFSKGAIWLARVIYDIGIKEGALSGTLCSVNYKQVAMHMEKHDSDFNTVGQELLRELVNLNMINLVGEQGQESNVNSSYKHITYSVDQLPRLIKLLKWQQFFNLDIVETI